MIDFRQHDLARDLLFLVLRAVTLQPLGAPTERGDRACALVLARSCAGDGQAAAVALLAASWRARRRDDDLLPRQDQRRAPDDALGFVLLAGCAGERSGQRGAGRGRGYAWDRRGRRRFAAGQAPSRLVLRLTLEIGFLSAAKFFVALARLGGLAFKAVARLALAPSPGVRLLAAAVLLLLRPRVDERPGARLALLGSQSGQDDSGLGRGRRGGFRRRRGGGPGCAGENGLGRLRGDLGRRDGRRRARRRRADRRRLARRQNAALYLLDDDRLAAPVRKALPHRALLNRALQMQRRLQGRGAHGLVAIVRFTHAYS